MKVCPKCGQATPLWSRDLRSGLCGPCVRAGAAQREREEREARETIVVEGKPLSCPICGHERFSKMRVSSWDLAVRLPSMTACSCKRCRYVMWFQRDEEG